MEQVIREAKEQNKNYIPFTTDSLLREAVDYYDRHGTANERLRARYLLGCAYRDLHEAPLAIITWEDAIACADTLSPDCDYATLFRVYGQMAQIYFRQYMPEQELKAREKYSEYAFHAGDTLAYVEGLLQKNDAYLALNDTDAIYQNIEHVRKLYLGMGRLAEAAQVYPSAIHIALDKQQFERAGTMMHIFETESGLFDEQGNIQSKRERYYYDKGRYYAGIGVLDSAEYQFRRLLSYEENSIDGYRGLLSVYRVRKEHDSICKYALLYEDALSRYLTNTNTDAIAQAEGMYNYHRQQQKAELKEQQARQRGIAILWMLAIIGMIILLGAQYYLKEKRKKREKERLLDAMTEDYNQALKTLTKTHEEIALLRQSLVKKEATETLLNEKVEQIVQLEQLIADLQRQISHSPDIKLYQNIEETNIMKLFQEISKPHYEKHEGIMARVDSRPATNWEWKEMEEMVRICHPQFYLFIKGHKLSALKFKVCFLSRYGFDNPQMAALTNSNIGSISNARKALAKELFGLESAYELDHRLRAT